MSLQELACALIAASISVLSVLSLLVWNLYLLFANGGFKIRERRLMDEAKRESDRADKWIEARAASETRAEKLSLELTAARARLHRLADVFDTEVSKSD